MNNPAKNLNWESDPAGRINNISLVPSSKNALFPLFEAIMNSIHAIEERFGKDDFAKGEIDIKIMRDDENDQTIGFTVTDNGIGFNDVNLESFKKMDSQKKLKLGGKGVGRLLWLKVMEKVRISSIFFKDEKYKKLEFDFTAEYPLLNVKSTDDADASKIGTRVELSPYRSVYATCLPKESIAIANRVLPHFVGFFINKSPPKITISDANESIDLSDKLVASKERDQAYEFEVSIGDKQNSFKLHCFLLPKEISDDEGGKNVLYLGANGRAVRRKNMDNILGLKIINEEFSFLGYIESDILDGSVNETRINFSLDEKEIKKIIKEATNPVKEFLAPEIQQVQVRQKKVVTAVRKEHPRFLSVARDIDEFTDSLQLLHQTDEEIYIELSRASLRQYKKRKNSYATSVRKKSSDIKQKATDLVKGLRADSISSLAEYVTRRKLILEVFEDSLKYVDNDKKISKPEKVIHDIICPMKTSTEDLDYEDHNLWILDDRLAFFTYFNSDQSLRKQIINPDSPRDRPDITAFDIFDEGLGFYQDNTQPITIIEFKRPKLDNYTLEKNPIIQVRKYVKQMRKSGQAQKYDGKKIRDIDENTPFHCHIIADMTPKLEEVMNQFGPFYKKAGTRCYYKWDEPSKIFIEISSFDDVLNSARARNEAFFTKLGIV